MGGQLVNWNIITPADAKVHTDAVAQALTAGTDPPPAAQPTADDYMSKLLKYVPPQIVGAYLLVQGALISVTAAGGDGRWRALMILLVAGALFTYVFTGQVLHVVRRRQRAVTTVAYLVWAFALGGVFATYGWWSPGWGTVALVTFGLLVQLVAIPPLPDGAQLS